MLKTSPSPPSRGRGLKHFALLCDGMFEGIAPITGARIETLLVSLGLAGVGDRPHHGGAD